MDNIKDLLTNFLANKKQVITFLLIGITVLSIPVGLRLVQTQQTTRSQAATPDMIRMCNEAIAREPNNIPPRPPECSNENADNDLNSEVCTWSGYKTYEELKVAMKQQNWTGDYNNNCSVLDAYTGLKSKPGQCVARVQEEYRKTGAEGSLDPWTQSKTISKVIALDKGFRVGVLNDRGVGNFAIENPTITLTTPDGQSSTVQNLSLYKPTRTGTYKIVASGGAQNGIKCASEATVQVTNQCASSCSQCLIKNNYNGFMVTYREGGWTDTSCSAYDRIIENWCSSADPNGCRTMKAGVCAAECAAGATAPADDAPPAGSPGGPGAPGGPTPVDVTYTGPGTVSCSANNTATFTWPRANISGKSVTNYTLRINKAPADWAPNVDAPPTTAVDGDRALQAGNNTSMTVSLTAGEYLDWTVQPGFSDGTVARNAADMGGSFTCPGGQGTPPTPPQGPAAPPSGNPGSGFVTDSVKIVEDNNRNSIPIDDPIWDDTNVVIEKPYSEVQGKKTPFTFRELVCVSSPCDPVPSGERWVHVLFVGRDSGGNVVKKSESQKIYLALEPKIDSISCEVSSSGNTAVTIAGSHFGATMGSVRMAEQNAVASATVWDNLTIRTTLNGQLGTHNENVTITTPEGLSVTGKCTLGKSQIDFTATLACRSVSKALTNASIEIKDASNSASIFKQERVNFDGNGRPQGVLPPVVENKDYIMTIQAPLSLRKSIPFKAQKGTTVLQAFDLPLGDIDPERTDCKINSLDIRRLFAEWASNTDAATRRGDLNQDGRVNSIDYACMRSNFDKSCDSP